MKFYFINPSLNFLMKYKAFKLYLGIKIGKYKYKISFLYHNQENCKIMAYFTSHPLRTNIYFLTYEINYLEKIKNKIFILGICYNDKIFYSFYFSWKNPLQWEIIVGIDDNLFEKFLNKISIYWYKCLVID